MVFSTKKYEKLSGEGAHPPPQTLPPVERGISPPHASPPRCLRHLDPSHSKILGTPLQLVTQFKKKFSPKYYLGPKI